MNFDRSLIFSYLEEDNIQRAYFRVRPLLTIDGDVREEAGQLWPNEGGLRIVPDRNEQHTFKVRMRTLGSYCVIDLRNQPTEAGKIRTNKNFRPDKGEVNQYILYSDTVHELPEHTFFQLLNGSAANYAELAKDAVTPLFFIREDDTLYGPVRKDFPAQPETAKETAAMLYEIPCPDGVSRLMLCIEEAKIIDLPAHKEEPEETVAAESAAPAPSDVSAEDKCEPAPVQEELPIGEELHILDSARNHEETLEQLNKPVSQDANLLHQKMAEIPAPAPIVPAHSEPLSGTPLVRTPLHVTGQQTKNRTQEIVSNQWSVGKYEPPAQNLPNGTAMHSVRNPVESACSHLKDAWNASSSHNQLLDFMLSLDGLRREMEVKLCGGNGVTLMQRVLRQRLQDLEAERLMALCELDRARRDADAYKQELMTALSSRIVRETGKLEADRKTAQEQVDTLKQQLNALTLQRDALLNKVNELQTNTLPEAVAKLLADVQMTAPITGVPLRISPVSGQLTDAEELIHRVMEVFSASGVPMLRNTAIALLVLLGVSARIGLVSSTPTAMATLTRNIVAALGWSQSFAHQYSAEQHPLIGMPPVDATPAVLATNLPNYAAISGATKLTLSRSTGNLIRTPAYDVNPWPVLNMFALPFVPQLTFSDATPVSAASLAKFVQHNAVSDAELDMVLSPILQAAPPLSGAARKEMYRFVSVSAGLMEGGLPAAADWGISLWIVPALERGSKQYAAVKALLDEFPFSLARM